jgi:gamma-butyrobetaine dioxygenase
VSAPDVARRIVELYERDGTDRYDEAVTQIEHAVQAARWAEEAGADDALIAAALLHDIGHLLSGDHRDEHHFRERDLRHEDVAARFLSRWFGPEVTEPIRLHVAAKRYLCAVEPGYHDGLSPASVRSLELQGGAMNAEEAAAFARLDGASAATELRRWDDLAKDPELPSRDIATFTDLLTRVARVPN